MLKTTMVENMKRMEVEVVYLPETSQRYSYNPYPASAGQNQGAVTERNQETTDNDGIYHFCAHCSLSFENVAEFQHHNIEMHGQKKILTCPICTATFRRQDHLKRHTQSLHYNQKYCICPVCKKDCKRQDYLLKHIKDKHNSDSEVFHCRECEFQCCSLKDLVKHEDSKHLLSDRHNCVHCNTSFKRKDHMLRHVKSQHLNQCITCPICNQKYKRKDHVVRHVREKHKMGYLNGKLITSSDIAV